MGISIIICTYNSSDLLKRCLISLSKVNDQYVDYEILIVDNNSNDNTKEVTEIFKKLNSKISYNFFPNQGLAKARNFGLSIASKEYILFTDDDITFDKDFLKAYEKLIKTKSPGMAGGRILLKYNSKRPNWLSDKVDFIYGWYDNGSKTTLYPLNSYPLGPSFLLKKSLLSKLGVFNPSLGLSGTKETVLRGEETDLAVRFRNNGILQYYCGESLVYHNVSEKRLNKEWFIARFANAGMVFEGLNYKNYSIFCIKCFLSKLLEVFYKKDPKKHFYFKCKYQYFKNILRNK